MKIWGLNIDVLEHKEIDDSESGGNGNSMIIGDAEKILGDCNLGDSIAVNGKYENIL